MRVSLVARQAFAREVTDATQSVEQKATDELVGGGAIVLPSPCRTRGAYDSCMSRIGLRSGLGALSARRDSGMIAVLHTWE
jgi:hypothetical protein